jgi:hypothetical protein
MPKIQLDDLIQKKPNDEEKGVSSKGKKPSPGKADVDLWTRLLNSLFTGLNDEDEPKGKTPSDKASEKPPEETLG